MSVINLYRYDDPEWVVYRTLDISSINANASGQKSFGFSLNDMGKSSDFFRMSITDDAGHESTMSAGIWCSSGVDVEVGFSFTATGSSLGIPNGTTANIELLTVNVTLPLDVEGQPPSGIGGIYLEHTFPNSTVVVSEVSNVTYSSGRYAGSLDIDISEDSGIHSWRTYWVDQDGTMSSKSSPFTYTLDLVNPTANISTPLNNQVYNTNNIIISGTAAEE